MALARPGSDQQRGRLRPLLLPQPSRHGNPPISRVLESLPDEVHDVLRMPEASPVFLHMLAALMSLMMTLASKTIARTTLRVSGNMSISFSPSLHTLMYVCCPIEEMAVQIEVEPSASEESSPFLSGTLDAGVMLELRTSFYDAINALYRYLCLEDRGQVWESCLDTYREVFKTFRARYSSERTVFLDRAPIEEALASQGLEVVPSVSHIISAANLVILMDAIHQVAVGNEEAVYLFHEIDEDFPHCIMTWDSVTENTHDDYRTSERALDIRISLWILQIAASQAVTEQAAMELGATLLFGTAPGFTMYPHEMDSETVEFRPIYGGEFSDPANEDEYLRAMRRDIFRDYTRVCRHITNGGVDLEGLQQAFSIQKSLDELFMWAKNIFKEVVKTIEQESARPVAETSTKSPMYGLFYVRFYTCIAC